MSVDATLWLGEGAALLAISVRDLKASTYGILGQPRMGTAPTSHRAPTGLRTQVETAVRLLANGGVVAVPTDTLYGLAACARDEDALGRVYQIKGRPASMALPVLLAEPDEMAEYAAEIPAITWRLVDSFFPGPLTLVFKSAGVLPGLVTGGKETIALRVPDHWAPRAIVRQLGAPITGTSANRSGSTGLTTAQAVNEHLGQDIDYIVDDGECPGGVQSTVVDLTTGSPVILREGAVPLRAIEEACGEEVGLAE